jgi:hypothetical protein
MNNLERWILAERRERMIKRVIALVLVAGFLACVIEYLFL